MREENEEKCSKLENEIFTQNCVIDKFKDELKERFECLKLEEEILQLVMEDINEEKEMKLQNISKEYELVKAKLKEIESKSLTSSEKSLEDELAEQMKEYLKCKKCEEEFRSPGCLNAHETFPCGKFKNEDVQG